MAEKATNPKDIFITFALPQRVVKGKPLSINTITKIRNFITKTI